MDTDPPDEFFELTADDLARIQQQANAKKQVRSRSLCGYPHDRSLRVCAFKQQKCWLHVFTNLHAHTTPLLLVAKPVQLAAGAQCDNCCCAYCCPCSKKLCSVLVLLVRLKRREQQQQWVL